MLPKTNRALHALANQVLPDAEEAHQLLRDLAGEKFGIGSTKDLTETQARALVVHLKEIKERMRRDIFKALNNGEGEPASEEQIHYVRQLRAMLGWSDEYLWTLINNRYQETSLEAMPKWKAVRLIAMMQKRWHSHKSKTEGVK